MSTKPASALKTIYKSVNPLTNITFHQTPMTTDTEVEAKLEKAHQWFLKNRRPRPSAQYGPDHRFRDKRRPPVLLHPQVVARSDLLGLGKAPSATLHPRPEPWFSNSIHGEPEKLQSPLQPTVPLRHDRRREHLIVLQAVTLLGTARSLPRHQNRRRASLP